MNLVLDPSAVVWSIPAQFRAQALASRPLLVMMHGRGSNEHDLVSIADWLPPQFVVASVRAPLQLATGSYSWFPAGEPGEPCLAAADAAVAALLNWLDSLAPTEAVCLLGFSQGGAMTLHAFRHAPERFLAGVNLAGFVIPGHAPADTGLTQLRPPIFWGSDPADPIIPADAIARTAEWLPAHSEPTVRHYDSIGHSISRQQIADVSDFLTGVLPAQ